MKNGTMSEVEKLDAGLPYDFHDAGVNARKLGAGAKTRELDALPSTEHARRLQLLRELFGSVGGATWASPNRSASATMYGSAVT